ncbi:sodium-coupled monocarboxylate transporter [Holotrichia oblita]|uniref:Sodium-coupled monocarboxylate transporter n=1 Tax=Holotrichia oblita TaxID=644536 RepID=A0ACB9TTS7_HOLOL|nr:sodium-coupled monocarboxylate transporter [Holotrichia oblita]
MIAAIIAVLYVGIQAVGGMGTVFSRSLAGERLDLDFAVDLTNRDTFWALVVGWSIHWSSLVAINQGAVQKCLSLPSIQEVKKTMLIFAIGSIFCKAASVLTGLVMYAHYHDCDPFLLKRVSKSDQLLPYYIMDVANKIPGLPGLFIAGVFCAALSTLSANMNALSGTIYQDFVSKFVPKDITDQQVSNILKGIVIIIGVTSTTMVLVVEKLGGILPLSIAFAGITAGPLLGLFALGMLFPSANAKGALSGSISSLLFGSIMMVGNQLYQATGTFKYASKPASIAGCANNITITATEATSLNAEENVFMLFRISHYYYTLIGMLVVLAIGLPVSWFTEREKSVDKDLITPCMQWAIPKTENEKLYGIITAEELKKLNESISTSKIL